jgi:hypothetical protein
MPNATSGCGTSDIISNTTNSTGVGLVPAYVFGITCDSNPGINYMSMDDNGDFQVAGNSGGNTLYAANLSAGGCLAATNFGTYYGQIGVTPCVSVTPGSGISVATPSAGVYQVTNTGVLSASGSGNITVTAGATPLVSITNAPSFTGNVTAGNVTDSALTSGNCVQASTGGLLTTTAAACGSGSGGVTSVTGSGNIQVTAGATPVVTITNAPNFTSNITVGTNGTANAGILFAAASGHTVEQVNGSQTVATISGTAINFNNGSTSYASMDQSGNLGLTGSLHATSFYGSGANITTGTIPDAALVTAPVTSLTAGSNIVVGSGSTPTVAVTNAPSFTGPLSASTLTATGLTSGDCVQASTGGLLTTATGACSTGTVTGLTAGNGIVVGTGPTPSVALANSITVSGNIITTGGVIQSGAPNGAANGILGMGNTLSSGGYTAFSSGSTTSVNGVAGNMFLVNGSVNNSMALDLNGNLGIFGGLHAANLTDTALTSGDCVQAGTGGLLSSATGGACPINYRGGTLQGGMHIETFTGSMTASTTTAFTFGTAYTTAPYCVVSTVANGAPVLSIAASPAISTTSVSVYNSSGSAANGNVSCIGY